jgi:hypothetical protein
MLVICSFAEKMLNRKVKKVYAYAIWIMVFVIDELIVLLDNKLVNLFAVGIIYMVAEQLIYSDRLKRKFIILAYYYVFGMIAELIANVLLLKFTTVGEEDFNLMGSVLSKIIFCVFIRIVMLMGKNKNDIKMNFKLWISVLVIPFSSVVLLLLIYYIRVEDAFDVLDIIIYGIILLINYVSYVQFDNIQKMVYLDMKNKLLEQESDYYVNQYEVTKELWDNIRKIRHDMKNEYIAEELMLQNGNYSQLEETYRKKIEEVQLARKYSESGNMYLDAVINYKGNLIVEEGGHLQGDISNADGLSIEGDDIVVLVGNLLDNALEALRNVKSYEKRCYIKVLYDRPNVMLEISNTYEGERIKKGENEYISTKDNKRMHGIGLITVKNIVKKYRGSVDICDEGNIFDVVVYIRENNI